MVARKQSGRPVLVAIGGFSGTGKSTLAAALAPGIGPAPGALHLRSDVERKIMLGKGETERLPAEHYTAEASARVYSRLHDKARAALRSGRPVVVDAVFASDAERHAIEAVAREEGARFVGLWLEAPPAVMQARINARRGDASDATAAVAQAQLARGVGAVGWVRIDAGGDRAETLAAARQAVEADTSRSTR